jgi:hypothetical protein
VSADRNLYGFPVVDRAEQARIIAAGARERLAAAPCTCAECVKVNNLPGVMRILAAKNRTI